MPICPAYAGVILKLDRLQKVVDDLSRICGGDPRPVICLLSSRKFVPHMRDSAQTRPRRRQGKAQLPLSLYKRIIREPYVKELSRHTLAACAAAVFHGSLDNGSAPDYAAVSCIF